MRRVRQASDRHDQVLRGDAPAALERDGPAIVCLVELRRDHIRVQLDIAAQVEAVGHVVCVAQDLGLARVALGPLPFLLQLVGERVGILHALDIAARARIAVPVPGAADARAALVDARRHPQPAQPMQHVEAGETGADDDRVVACLRVSRHRFSDFAPAKTRGGPGGSRTPDLRFRKPLLYPAELRDRARRYSMSMRPRNPTSIVKQPTLRRPFEVARGRALRPFPLPRENEGSRAPTGAGAEAPHPVVRLASGPISGSPEITGP